jgi:MFS family permease
MLKVLASSWALLLGLMMLMLGNGMQGSLLGIRGAIENFSTEQLSVVMSCYFVGFLFGSRMAPGMIRRVGHVRVFAALGSMISAVLILYAAAPHWIVWALLRVVIGFSFSGVYITAESWLNNASTNETRGQAMSLYLMVQMIGIIASQLLLNVADPAGWMLFVIPSVLVSLAFTPILLAAAPAPSFENTRPMSFRALFNTSPLGCVGIFLLGGIFSAQFGMASVWAIEAGLNVQELSIFVAVIYTGGLVLQYPIGWLSDRMDRRRLILMSSAFGMAVTALPFFMPTPFWLLLVVAFFMGGVSNPLYSLILAYVNDYLSQSDMASASAGLIFINGLGAIGGPVVVGWMMSSFGPDAFYLYMSVIFGVLLLYGVYRTTRRRTTPDASGAFTALTPTASVIAVEAAMDRTDDDGAPRHP